MSLELRHDIPVLLCVVSSVLLLIGAPPIVDWSERRRFDKRVQITAAIAVALFMSVGGLIYLIQLPGSRDVAAYLGIVCAGAVYALGWYAQNRIVRVMAWNGWPQTYALRYVLERNVLAPLVVVAALAAGAAIYEAVK